MLKIINVEWLDGNDNGNTPRAYATLQKAGLSMLYSL